MYGKLGVERKIEGLLGTIPIPRLVIEAGMLDGIIGSNTRYFVEKGWRGVWIEPIPSNFQKLVRNSEGLNVELHNVALVDEMPQGGTAQMCYFPGHPGGSSLLSPDERSFHPKRRHIYDNYDMVEVECRLLTDIVREDTDVGFLSLDVEDKDTDILQHMVDSTKLRPRIVLSEGRTSEALLKQRDIMRPDYRVVGNYASNQLFFRRDLWQLIQHARSR